jgi:hypothetical protein
MGSGSTSQLSGPLSITGTTKDLAEAYIIGKGAFKPAPPAPRAKRQGLPASMIRRLQQADTKANLTSDLKDLLRSNEVEEKKCKGLFEDHFRSVRCL